ncbi:MAG TPA: hypothetical protein VFA44_01040 [Gaiellaceae bacterium]|nr:hypothetical protein [Gaiellaceae bacterium]
MRWVIVVCALAAAAAYAVGAWSASPPTPTEKRLLKDVAALKSQVKTLQTQVRTVSSNEQEAAAALAVVAVCGDVLAADALQGTWQVIDQLSSATQAGKTYFGPQTPLAASVASQDVCQALGVSRSQVVPPTVAPYQALLGGLGSGGAAPAGFRLGRR